MTTNKGAVTTSCVPEHLIGRVKWFNNKAGYGFINVTDGSRSGTDIFVHHSAINVESQQYKYLIQGEYVEFDLVKTDSTAHEWQASNVAGIRGGKLMCETHNELKVARNQYKSEKSPHNTHVHRQRVPSEKQEDMCPSKESVPRQRKNDRSRVRNEEQSSDKKEWKLVSRSRSAHKKSPDAPYKKALISNETN